MFISIPRERVINELCDGLKQSIIFLFIERFVLVIVLHSDPTAIEMENIEEFTVTEEDLATLL